ncbi:HTH domain-containing protein [Candidatus Woesearchaeota archaeon]|nr:HTH domain-containing protein [Candidatus Woesearchaeota archaeon]
MEIYNNIVHILEQSQRGLLTNEISEKLNLERHTASKYLQLLKEKGIISVKEIGKAKLWFLSNDSKLEQLKKISDKLGISLDSLFSSLAHDIVVIDKNNKIIIGKTKCDERKCKTCMTKKTLTTGKEQKMINKNLELISSPIKDDRGKTIGIIEFSRRLK